MPVSDDDSPATSLLRKCACRCLPECKCACSCRHHCTCMSKCQGTCREAPAHRSRNLVVSIDGTSYQFGPNNTNVVELHSRIIKEHPSTPQLTFYVSGIGTYVPPSWSSFASWKQWIANIIDLAIAWNFEQHVQDAYRWLAGHYQPGDVIYLFGFSRGAYQVRALAGMIATVGLVYSGNQRLIPFAYELYCNQLKGKEIDRKEAGELCAHFKKIFSRDVRVHFLGAWDTVSCVGIFRGQPLPLTTSADHICHFRHALALDERRVRFQPEYVNSACSQESKTHNDQQSEARQPETQGTIKEVWFAGTHSDIGGGNRRNIALDLAGVPLLWMENQATISGLHLVPRIDVWNWESLKQDKPIESLTGPFWWLLETLPLTRSKYNAGNLDQTIRWPPHRGKGRVIMKDQLVHASVAFKDWTYKPRAAFSYIPWRFLVGQGNLQDIRWAQEWRQFLEMDLFDPSLARETGGKFVAATTAEAKRQYLAHIPFLALSDGAVSSLVDAGVVTELMSILADPDADSEMQAISSTSLELIIKSSRLARDDLEKSASTVCTSLTTALAKSNLRQKIAHLTLLTRLDPEAHLDDWENVANAILDLVSNPETKPADFHLTVAFLERFTRTEGFPQVF
ncbi:hypothetical protein C8R44DRAFT_974480, partial [Mycena epipterygia]